MRVVHPFFVPGSAAMASARRPVATSARLTGPPSPAVSRANAPLGSLAGRALASRFHAWPGASGQRYVFSVYPVIVSKAFGGLPDFPDAIGLSVQIDASGKRSRINVFEFGWQDDVFNGDARQVHEALSAGALEWHVHLLAASAQERRAAIDDLRDSAPDAQNRQLF